MPTDIVTPITEPEQPPAEGQSNETFETWIEKQDDTVKALYTTHTAGLKTALDGERQANRTMKTQLQDMVKKAEKGSELETALNQQIGLLSASEKRAAFQDKAHTAGVRNLKLAFIAADQLGLVSEKGECDFAKLKAEYPELFATAAQVQQVNAGTGTGQQSQKTGMEGILRGAFGR